MAQTEETTTGQPSEATPPPATEPTPKQAETESEADEVAEPEEDNTPVSELVQAAGAAVQHLQRAKHLNPAFLRDFLANDTYPLLMEFMSMVDYYVMDLHNRVLTLEGGEDDDEGVEYMDPQFAAGVLEYVGRFLQISERLLAWAKEHKDDEATMNLQLLVASSPGIMMHIQQVMEAQEEDEDEDEEEEDDEAYGESERAEDAEHVVEPERTVDKTDEPAAEPKKEESDG